MLLFHTAISSSQCRNYRIYCLFAKHDSFRIHVKTHNQRLLHFYGTVNNNNNKNWNKFNRNVLFGCQIPNWCVFAIKSIVGAKNDIEAKQTNKNRIGMEVENVSLKLSCLLKVMFALLNAQRAQSVCLLQICSMQTETGKSVAQYTTYIELHWATSRYTPKIPPIVRYTAKDCHKKI